ncbi:hypothetical protein R3P38DRAFT_2361050, partial [Favolaschia claudopus]
NQESWDGSSRHPKGDVNVSGFFSDAAVKIRCRKVDLTCNGIDWCQFPDRSHFAGCERYEADEEEMCKLWNHELDQNEVEAASHIGIIARFYTRIRNAECKVPCDGVPILVRYTQNALAYGKEHFIGCSGWNLGERGRHIYFAIPANVPERDVRYLVENDGNLPPGHDLPDTKCVLTVHPRVKLQNCHTSYSHIINNQIVPAKMERRGCDSKLIIFVPINFSPDTAHKAIILLKKPHNHPMHPPSKPNASDQLKLRTAVTETGVLGLTVQKILNAPSTSRIYDGKRVAEVSPAYTDTREIRDALAAEKLREHPHGMDWKGVLHHINNHELRLPKAERYIHTAVTKNGFRLVVTLHPQLAMLIHKVLALNIDYTFKRVGDNMDEWEVVGFVDRLKKRKSISHSISWTKAFSQLFKEFFDTVEDVTGQKLLIAPFYKDAQRRIFMLDGEAPQALGLGAFLSTYNKPEISGIWTTNPIKQLLSYCLKTCSIHFERHINEMPPDIPKSTLNLLKSIMHARTQEEVDAWWEAVEKETHPTVVAWVKHKHDNICLLNSVNKFLSNISEENFDITPNHSNLPESGHPGRNAETGIKMPLLTAILKSQERDNIKVREMSGVETNAIMSKRWNDSAERKKLSAQRKIWTARKAAERTDQLSSYDSLQVARDSEVQEQSASLERQKELEVQIKSLQEQMKIDKHHSDFKELIVELCREIDEEKDLQQK